MLPMSKYSTPCSLKALNRSAHLSVQRCGNGNFIKRPYSASRPWRAIIARRYSDADVGGIPVQPKNVVGQIEGAVIYGTSNALYERARVKEGGWSNPTSTTMP